MVLCAQPPINRNVAYNTKGSSLPFKNVFNICFLRLNDKLTTMLTCQLPWFYLFYFEIVIVGYTWRDSTLLLCSFHGNKNSHSCNYN